MSRLVEFVWGTLMNFIVRYGLTVSTLLGLAVSPQSQAGESRLERIRAERSLSVCVWPDYYGISFRNPKTRQLSGIDADMALEFGKDLGVAVQFVDSSFATLIDDVSQGRCDIAMFAVGITPQRLLKLRFSQPHLASDIYAIASKTNRRVKNWADIDQAGVVVAVAKGTLHEPVMQQNLRVAQLLVLDTPFAREQEVQSGRADVFITDYPYSQRFLTNADWARRLTPPAAYHVTSYAYAVKPGDDAWHARVDQFVAEIKRDGRLLEAARRHHLEAIVIP
jgi:cyclohexadienyl dehydratase